MKIVFQCECGESYNCNFNTVEVWWPVIKTRCPNCGKRVKQNMGKFLQDQTDKYNLGKAAQASLMIKMARQIVREFNDDIPGQRIKR